ncbi:MAG: hypothetical protein AAF078_14240, partial [Planctomycetota bacterium]
MTQVTPDDRRARDDRLRDVVDLRLGLFARGAGVSDEGEAELVGAAVERLLIEHDAVLEVRLEQTLRHVVEHEHHAYGHRRDREDQRRLLAVRERPREAVVVRHVAVGDAHDRHGVLERLERLVLHELGLRRLERGAVPEVSEEALRLAERVTLGESAHVFGEDDDGVAALGERERELAALGAGAVTERGKRLAVDESVEAIARLGRECLDLLRGGLLERDAVPAVAGICAKRDEIARAVDGCESRARALDVIVGAGRGPLAAGCLWCAAWRGGRLGLVLDTLRVD